MNDKSELWVRVEEYLPGTITDIVGASVHFRVDGQDEIITIASPRYALDQQLPATTPRRALLRVEAEQNIHTGARRGHTLIALVPDAPHPDDAALERFTQEGRRAWADVPDAAAWVRDLRGRDPAW